MLTLARTLLWLVFSVGLVQSAVQKTTAIFQVDFSKGQDDQGGCRDVGETTMDNYISDAYTLAEAGITLMDDYDNGVAEAQRLVDVLFSLANGNNINSARDSFTAVRGFLDGSRQISGGKPYLFCHSTWLIRQVMSDIYIDSTGNVQYGFDKNGNLHQVKNNEVGHMVNGKANYGGNPYFSQLHKAYLFDRDYPNNQVGYCSLTKNRAATQEQTPPHAITLCPASFTPARRLRAADMGTPVTAAAVQISNRNAARTSKRLTDILPTASNIFHELFHLTLGNAATNPQSGDEQYGWNGIVALGATDSLRNPETFTLAAVAYDITRNSAPDQNGHRHEFYSNIGTVG